MNHYKIVRQFIDRAIECNADVKHIEYLNETHTKSRYVIYLGMHSVSIYTKTTITGDICVEKAFFGDAEITNIEQSGYYLLVVYVIDKIRAKRNESLEALFFAILITMILANILK